MAIGKNYLITYHYNGDTPVLDKIEVEPFSYDTAVNDPHIVTKNQTRGNYVTVCFPQAEDNALGMDNQTLESFLADALGLEYDGTTFAPANIVAPTLFIYGKATAAITEGQLIMVTGAVGASGVVTFAPTTTGLLDPNAILGIATENIALNGFGRVTMLGIVHGIDTTGSSVGEVWADGDVLWYNTAFVGSMTNVKPVAPNMKTQVAIVINAGSGGSGSLQVEVINGSTLGGTDANVQFSALADKQLLQYDFVAGYWKNVAVSAVGSTAAETHAAASKTTPVDADEIPLADSASSFSLKKLTWANLKATLATWIGGNLIAGSFTSLASSTTGQVATTLGVGGATPSASGAGISFPGTQSASSNANTLDDYEEGTFSPTIVGTTTAGVGTYNNATGRYTKIGDIVFIEIWINMSAHTGTGNMVVGGLPFTSNATAGVNAPFTIGTVSGLTLPANAWLNAYLPNNSTQVVLQTTSTAGGSISSAALALDTAFLINLSGTYKV